jgi:hypothetical protein
MAVIMTTAMASAAIAEEKGPALPMAAFVRGGCTSGGATRTIPQVVFGQGPGSALSVRLAADGTAVLEATAGELRVRKVVHPNGHFVLTLQARNDQVTIRADGTVFDVRRGDESATIDPFVTTEERFLDVKKLLAGSRAVRAFRGIAASLAGASELTPGGTALVASDALVGYLDGDVGAVERLGRRFLDRRAAQLRSVNLLRGPGCYEIYEAEVIRAWSDYLECRDSFAWWNPLKEGCTLRWMLWAESSWFSFLSCSAFPFAR